MFEIVCLLCIFACVSSINLYLKKKKNNKSLIVSRHFLLVNDSDKWNYMCGGFQLLKQTSPLYPPSLL